MKMTKYETPEQASQRNKNLRDTAAARLRANFEYNQRVKKGLNLNQRVVARAAKEA